MHTRSSLSVLAALAFLLAVPAARATTVTFSGLSGSVDGYAESGFVFSSPQVQYSCSPDGSHTSCTPVYVVQFSGSPGGIIASEFGKSFSVSEVSGGAFTFDAATLSAVGNGFTYTFLGSLAGSSVFSFTENGQTTPTTYLSGQDAALIDKLTVEAGPFVTVENLTFGPASATPEPSSVALVATGLLASAGAIRRRLQA